MRQEPKTIIETYKETGSVSRTAELCGISRMTVYRWLKRVRESALSGAEKMPVAGARRETGFCAEKIRKMTGVPASVSGAPPTTPPVLRTLSAFHP